MIITFYFYFFVLQFVVVKFLSTNDNKDDNEYDEVALSKWLKNLDENMIGNIFWPGDKSQIGTLV